SKAERQLIEAAPLLPETLPPYLRLRWLMTWADLKSRGGHYEESLTRYNDALRLVDASFPSWRRIDVRGALAGMLMDARQEEKAAEVNHEQMRLATEAGDEF